MTVKITIDSKSPQGKLAEAELHFEDASDQQKAAYQIALATWGANDHVTRAIKAGIDASAQLAGLRLIGFAIWQRRGGSGRNVTFPARTYKLNGESRSFALLRPLTDPTSQDRVRDLILAAYDQHVADTAEPPTIID